MTSPELTTQLRPKDANRSLKLLRNILLETFAEEGGVDPPDAFQVTWRSILAMRRKIGRQFQADDDTYPRYRGVKVEHGHRLVAIGKASRPLESKEGYAGHAEDLLGKVKRRLGQPTNRTSLVDKGATTEINELHVAKQWRGYGLGTNILYALLSDVHPDTENVRVAALEGTEGWYARFGFIPTGEFSHWPDPTDDEGLSTTRMMAPLTVVRDTAQQLMSQRA